MARAQAERTHCPRGHPYVEGNIIPSRYTLKDGTVKYGRKCAECSRQRQNRVRYPTSMKQKVAAESARRYAERNPEKVRAHKIVQWAVKKGDLIKPEECSKCGKSGEEAGRIEGSHDDYSKPREVTWLCVWCHREKDRKLKLPAMAGVLQQTVAEED